MTKPKKPSRIETYSGKDLTDAIRELSGCWPPEEMLHDATHIEYEVFGEKVRGRDIKVKFYFK